MGNAQSAEQQGSHHTSRQNPLASAETPGGLAKVTQRGSRRTRSTGTQDSAATAPNNQPANNLSEGDNVEKGQIGPMAADLLSPIIGSPPPESELSGRSGIPISQGRWPGQTVVPEAFPATLPNADGFEQFRGAATPAVIQSQRQSQQQQQQQAIKPIPTGHRRKESLSTAVAGPAQLIPILIRWTRPGEHVYMAGSFNDWRYKVKLHKTGSGEWQAVVDLPPGTHCIKFIVDDQWQCSSDFLIAPDDDGNLVNYINVDKHHHYRPDAWHPAGLDAMEIDEEAADQSLRQEGFGPDGYYHHHHRSHHHHHHHHQRRISQEGANGQWYRSKIEEDPEDDSNVEGLDASLLSGSPPGDYTDQLPDWNELMAKFRESAGSHGSSSRHRDPPMLPPHLSNVLLNSADPPKNDVNVLPVPNHVVLNHLYACSIKDNVMAVSTTSRYRGKYLTTIYYKPV